MEGVINGRRQVSPHWFLSRDGDPDALQLMKRHYSWHEYKDGRPHKLFVGPGFKIVLLTEALNALFVWRKFKCADGQQGVNCAVFRNESDVQSSELIMEAEKVAWHRWPGERLFTYVNARKVKSQNPGYCFMRAGWQKVGITKWNKLVILKKDAVTAK